MLGLIERKRVEMGSKVKDHAVDEKKSGHDPQYPSENMNCIDFHFYQRA